MVMVALGQGLDILLEPAWGPGASHLLRLKLQLNMAWVVLVALVVLEALVDCIQGRCQEQDLEWGPRLLNMEYQEECQGEYQGEYQEEYQGVYQEGYQEEYQDCYREVHPWLVDFHQQPKQLNMG